MDQAIATVRLPPHAAAVVGIPELPIRGFVADQSVFAVVQATGAYEPHIMDVIAAKLPAGGVFVDVGANIGILSALAAARVGPDGTVVAIEASPITSTLLSVNLCQPGGGHCTVINRGVWDQPASLILSHVTEGPGWSFVSAHQSDLGIAFVLNCDTLDALLAQAGVAHVDLLKVDVEGAELAALRGAQHLLTTARPTLVLEVNPDTLNRVAGASAADLYQCVRDFGYDVKVIATDGTLVPVPAFADLQRWLTQYVLVDVLCEQPALAAPGGEGPAG